MEEYKKYLDESLSFRERARDLADRMDLHELAAQLLFDADAVPRLGVKAYNWWNEALHGVARSGMATVFPQAIGMAASFDPALMQEVGDVISTEGRAKYNEYQKAGDYGIYKGLTFWSPNVNLFRDPRWGRGQETYGEDPYLTEKMGIAFVKGVQGEDLRYLKAAACAKHFAVHSGPEELRHEFDAKVTPQEMEETYLPQFRALARAGVAGFMGAYNRVNGEVCCGSPTLLQKILRGKWGYQGYITSDCWAINDFHAHHKVTDGPLQSVKLALENGCQLNCGCTYEYIQLAVEQGLISEELVRDTVAELMETRFRLGLFDRETPWDKLNIADVDTPHAREINERMARESLVLLKNDGILPLDPGTLKTITVTGGNADSIIALNGNYHGTANEYCTVLEGIRKVFADSRVLYSESFLTEVENDKEDGFSEVQAMARISDLILVVTGLDETLEGEENMSAPQFKGDKEDLRLPKFQRELLKVVAATGKPFIIVNMTGSAIDLEEAGEKANAVIQAWYPGALGGKAVAELLSGGYSPSGKLPVTFYKNENELPEFTEYSMKERTYKFFTGEPRYPFGYGLSYTEFLWSDLQAPEQVTKLSLEKEEVRVSVKVTNTGRVASDCVTEFYLADLESSSEMNPGYRLAGFGRVFLAPGESGRVEVSIPKDLFAVVDTEGERVLEAGDFVLYAGGCQPDRYSEELSSAACVKKKILLK